MTRWRAYVPHLSVAIFALVVASPLARGLGTCTDDAALHITRAVEIERLIRLGHFFPRWAPDLAHGFGYPLFNYYAPLSAYVVVLFHQLGVNFSIALHLTFFVALLAAGLAAFVLGRDLWGERAGLVAAAGYVSAPYFAFDILYRGALAESFAWVWPPLVLWAILRALRRSPVGSKSIRYSLLASGAYAGLILTHNTLALLASPVAVGFVLLLAWEKRGKSGRRPWRDSLPTLAHGGLILLGGLALSAYFWVPAFLEQDLVQTDRLLVPPIFTYYTNWLTPQELLAPPTPDDPRLINASPPKALGLVPALLALPALAGLLRREFRPQWPRIGFLAASLVAYSLMTLPVTGLLWDRLPLLAITQFPWRMLSLAALCAALLAGAAVRAFDRAGSPLTVILGAGLVLGNLPWWYPRYCTSLKEHDVASISRYEYDTHTIGTSAKGEFLPRTVASIPPDDTLAQAILEGREPDRVDRSSLPPGAEYAYLDADPLGTRLTLSSPLPFTLAYKTFYFPGWQALVDGQPVKIVTTRDYGLISFNVPSGDHVLEVRFGSTPLRHGASIGSMIALISGLSMLILLRPRTPPSSVPNSPGTVSVPLLPNSTTALSPAFLLLPVALLALKLGYLDHFPSPLRWSQFDGESGTPAKVALKADFSGGIRLYGFDVSKWEVPTGGSTDVSVYVGLREHTDTRYWPAFTVEDWSGLLWSAPDQIPPRWHREPPFTPLWRTIPDGYAQWSRQVSILDGTPPGTYQLWLTVFDLDTKIPDSAINEIGNAANPRLLLGEITISRDRPHEGELVPEHRIGEPLSPSLTLLGYDLDRTVARSGDTWLLVAYWQARRPPHGETLLVQLSGVDGEALWELEPVPGYPATLWEPGDAWRGAHRLTLPAKLPGGTYRLLVGIRGNRMVELTTLEVEAPVRQFDRPTVQERLEAQVGELARLVGYSFEDGSLTLVWQALSETPVSYSVFVHLTDPSGRIWAQHDGIPAGYSRPTTSWVKGEFIVDPHPLQFPSDLPPGDYQLFAGLYEPRSGERLPTGTEDRRINLGGLAKP